MDTVCSKSKTIRIAGDRKSLAVVKSQCMKLEDAQDELEKLKIREQVKKEMALRDMEYAKRELKRVNGV